MGVTIYYIYIQLYTSSIKHHVAGSCDFTTVKRFMDFVILFSVLPVFLIFFLVLGVDVSVFFSYFICYTFVIALHKDGYI